MSICVPRISWSIRHAHQRRIIDLRPSFCFSPSSLLTRFLSIESHVPSVLPSSNVLYPRETWWFPFIMTWHKYWTRVRQHTTTKHKLLNQHDGRALLSALPVSLPELPYGVPLLGGDSVPTQVWFENGNRDGLHPNGWPSSVQDTDTRTIT